MDLLSFTEENYIKSIYHLSEDSSAYVSTNALAESMQTRPATVSDMLKRLAQKNLVHYQKYKGVQLTENGKKNALQVIRKHRLWEVFLFEKLNFHWDEVHEVAEQLEHVRSPLLVEKLDGFLGSPHVDPHGDPIPDAEGQFSVSPQQPLAELPIGEPAVISSVVNNNPKLLRYLDKKGIRLGLKIKILEREEFDGSILLELNAKAQSYLSDQITQSLMVRKI